MNESTNNYSKNEEIDLNIFLNILFRNKFFILKFTVITFIISCLFAFSKKRVWQGQFEIVLSESSKNASLNNSIVSTLQRFNVSGLLDNQNQSLNTEVAILESPSVLMPIFDYVKEKKIKQNDQSTISNFFLWKNRNLNFNLRKKTSILNISYKDTNKELIIPVLTRISSTYQEYSGKRKKRNTEIAQNYIIDQIKIYKNKSNLSRKVSVEYAIDNDLTFKDMQNSFDNKTPIENILPEITRNFDNQLGFLKSFSTQTNTSIRRNSIENIRVSAANEIKNIDYQIKKIQSIEDIKELQYLGSTIPSLSNLGLPQSLEKIETQLVELRSKYTENDLTIQKLLDKRKLYTSLIKERSIGYLKARKLATEAMMASVERPKGVIVKGKELMREAERDERTLIELENNLRAIQLTSAKEEDPWELITQPTLNQIPVSPNRSKIGLIGIFIGFFFGYIYSYLKEKKSSLIFEESELMNLLEAPILKRLPLSESSIEELQNELKLSELENFSKKLFIILSSKVFKKNKKQIEIYLSQLKNEQNKKINYELINDNYSIINPENSTLLITSLEKIEKDEIKNLKNRLKALSIKLDGILLLENN